MKSSITKEEIKKIISTERLTPGEFINGPEACVMGRIAQYIYAPDNVYATTINDLCDRLTEGRSMSPRPARLAQAGNIFGGLSATFENTSFRNGDIVNFDVKFELISFVDKFFPNKIDLKGYK